MPTSDRTRAKTASVIAIAVAAVLVVAAFPLAHGSSGSVSTADQRAASAWTEQNPLMWSWMTDHWSEMTQMHEHWGDTAWMQANLPDYPWMQQHWAGMSWMQDHWAGMGWMHDQGMMGGSSPGGMMGG